jgi:hypothetical protein
MNRRCSNVLALAVVAGAAASVSGQTATMPPHAAGFTGATRGYWFTAPTSFEITGVQVKQIADPGANGFMNWAIVRFNNNTPPPTFAAVTNDFVQLDFGLNEASNAFSPTSIIINAGDVIGIYGNTAAASGTTTGVNSYTATLTQATTTVLGNTINLNRSGMQFHLGSATSPQGMHDLWSEPASTAVSRVEFTYAPIGVTGRCCLANGSCLVTSAGGCSGLGGTYGGDGTNCTPNPCPQPPTGACCFFASCSVVTQANCTSQGGTYQGDNSVCGSCPAVPPVFYANCNISTGPTTLSGVAAAPGNLWSECAKDDTIPTVTNTTAGFTGTGTFRMADDFVIPAGGMNVAYVKVYAYHSSATPTLATGATLRILDGSPAGAANVVFGDTTTNRMANVAFTNIYRIFPTTVGLGSGVPCVNGAPTAPGTTRRLQEIYITVNQFLPAGTYWIDYAFLHAATMFVPPATQADAIGRACNPNNSNALQSNAGVWGPANDGGHGCDPSGNPVNNPAGTNPINVQQDMYFELLGTSGTVPCYANCDQTGGLTANDFICFLTAFNNNQSYADCDGVGGLTANDFICFVTAYNAGCS